MTLHEYDVVRLRRSLPEHRLSEGDIGAIVMVFDRPPAYEVEFCDTNGVTRALVTLTAEDIEQVPA